MMYNPDKYMVQVVGTGLCNPYPLYSFTLIFCIDSLLCPKKHVLKCIKCINSAYLCKKNTQTIFNLHNINVLMHNLRTLLHCIGNTFSI